MTGGVPPKVQARTRSKGIVGILVLLLLAGGIPTPAGADGADHTLGTLLEAETFQTADAPCDPDFDGEHTVAVNDTAASGGAYAFLPHSGCGIGFGDVSFDADRRFTQFVVRVGGSNDTYSGLLRVLADDVVVAEGHYSAHPTDGFVTLPFDRLSHTVLAGIHTLRVEFTTMGGPYYGNLEIDVLRTETTSGGGGGGGGGGPIFPLPDLTVTVDRIVSDAWDPSTLRVSFRLDNKGHGIADPVAIDVWYDGTYAGRIDHPWSLGPGWTTWVSHPWPHTSGNHTIRVVVDPTGIVDEMDEENNAHQLEVPADTPDAYVNRVWDPEPLDADGWTQVRFFVFSVGTTAMPPSTVEIRLDGVVHTTATTAALPVGTAQELVVPFHAEPGSYLMTIHLDPLDTIPELEERHNEWRMHVDLAPPPVPDLVAALAIPDLAGAYYGDTFPATATVHNAGDAWSTDARATVTLDDVVLFDRALPPIGPNETHTFQVDIPLHPGADHLQLALDPNGGPEAEPADNLAEVHLALGVPELTATTLAVDDEVVPEAGRPIDVTAAFTYNGTLALPGAQAVLMEGDRILETWTLDSVLPNATHTFGYTWTAREGDHTLRFEVSAPRTIAEPATEDNHLVRDVHVRAPTPATCRDAGAVTGSPELRESCRRVLLGEEDPLGPL